MTTPLTLDTKANWMAVTKWRGKMYVHENDDGHEWTARNYICEVLEKEDIVRVFAAPSLIELDKTRDVTVEFAALVAAYLMELSPYNWPRNLVWFAYAYGHREALETYDHEWRMENVG